MYECELYWIRPGVPRREINDMLSELERHLREADEDGKPTEAVVGENVKAFAESWAAENRPPQELGKRLLILAEYFTIAVPIFAAFTHLWYRQLYFDVNLGLLLPVWTFIFSLSLNLFPTLTVIEHLKPRWKRYLAVAVLSSLTVFVPAGIIWLVLGSSYAPLFGWSWPATLILALVALVVYGLRRRFVPDARTIMRRKFR